MLEASLDANSIAEMALQLHDEPGTAETVERVCDYALKAIDCDYAGVIFLHKKKAAIETIAATDPLIEKLDRIQMDLARAPTSKRSPTASA